MSVVEKVIAIVPAAGSGERMRLPQSKLLCPVSGQSILARTLTTLSESGVFQSILVPCRPSDKEKFSECAKGLSTPIEFCNGGSTRQESVKNALRRIQESNLPKDNLIVLIQDAARCFVSKKLIERSIDAAKSHKAVSAAIACVDTVYQADDKNCIQSPLLERSNLRSIQTPQVFEFNLLWQAHNLSSQQYSDDAGLVAKIHPVTLIEGERSNFKITTIEDLKIAEIIARGG